MRAGDQDIELDLDLEENIIKNNNNNIGAHGAHDNIRAHGAQQRQQLGSQVIERQHQLDGDIENNNNNIEYEREREQLLEQLRQIRAQYEGINENNNNERVNENIELNEIPRDNEPIPEPPRRTTRTPQPREFFQPSFKGQAYKEVNHLITQVHPKETLEYEAGEVNLLAEAFTQTYSLTRGIKKFGDKGKQAAIDEMKQLHDRACFRPIDINKMDEATQKNSYGIPYISS